MTRRLHSGLYEDLLTSALEAEVWWVDVIPADPTVRPEILARHVYHLLRRALEGMPDDGDQPANQVVLANRLVEVLVEYGAVVDDRVADAARLLLEAVEHRAMGGSQSAVSRLTLSLHRTGLLVNGRRDVQIANEIARENPSADRIDLLCAFVRHSGLHGFLPASCRRSDTSYSGCIPSRATFGLQSVFPDHVTHSRHVGLGCRRPPRSTGTNPALLRR